MPDFIGEFQQTIESSSVTLRAISEAESTQPLAPGKWSRKQIIMAAVPAEERRRTHSNHSLDMIAWRTIPKDTPATLEYLMLDYIEHLKHHLGQIVGG